MLASRWIRMVSRLRRPISPNICNAQPSNLFPIKSPYGDIGPNQALLLLHSSMSNTLGYFQRTTTGHIIPRYKGSKERCVDQS